jgi:hypothetical protein
MTSTIKVDTISENTSANGVAIDGVTLKDGGLTTTAAVGIGTSSPPKTLSIQQDGGSAAMGIDVHNLGTNTADDALITFETQGHRNYSIGIDRSLAGFVIAKSDGFGTPHLIVDDSGNLGLGTTSVDVSTQAGGSGYRVLQIENDEGGQINLDHNDAGTGSTLGQINFQRAGEVLATIDGVTDGATDNGKINFRTQPNGGALTTRWTIDHDGIIYPGSTSQGIALGVTAATASNILDDYEEGTFTPTLNGSSGAPSGVNYSIRGASYTKIGRSVTCHIYMALSSFSSGPSGDAIITGLPFTAADTNATFASATVGYCDGWSSSDAPQTGYVERNGSRILLMTNQSADARDDLRTHCSASNMSGDEVIIISVTFSVA